MSNKLTYPFKTMRITQNYNGTTSHAPHNLGSPKDYPIDEGCSDAGRDWAYCSCDELKVVKIYGVGNKGVNTIWLTSTSKCDLANGKSSIITLLMTHPNDDDLKKIKVGQIFKRGEKICREGIDGATGNHIHLVVGLGIISGNGWVNNSLNKWVLTTSDGPIKPEDAFYIDKSFTTIKADKGLKFKSLPSSSSKTSSTKTSTSSTKSSTKKYTLGDYKVTTDLLRVRNGPGTDHLYKTFDQLTQNAKKQILKLNKEVEANGFVKGIEFTVTKIEGNWGLCPSGWVCLDYCKKI